MALCIGAAALACEDTVGAALAEAARDRDHPRVLELLDDPGVDVNQPGCDGTPALHWLVRVQALEPATRLLEAGADADAASRHGLRPLHIAAGNGDAAMVALLLQHGARADATDGAGESALYVAARHGDDALVRLLLEHDATVDLRDPHQQTPLMVAVRSGSEATVRLLLEHGADPVAQTRAGAVPAFRRPEDNAGSRGVGITRGGLPRHGERDPVPGAKTPLLYATRAGDLALTRMLVEAGADMEQPDANGITPLLNAIINKSVTSRTSGRTQHLEVARYLIEQGANVNTIDWYGQTPLWAAVDVRNLDVRGATRDNRVNREQALELVSLLLERGANPDARIHEYPPQRRFITNLGSLAWVDFTGQTPFLRAALAGDVTVMRMLVEHGADPGIATFAGTTPLMAAAGVNWVFNQTFDEGAEALLEAVQLAHELGNDINATNSMGLRAIHGAANRGSNDIIEFLVDRGAELDVADNEGRTPMVWAEGVFLATHPPERKPETVALLESLADEAG